MSIHGHWLATLPGVRLRNPLNGSQGFTAGATFAAARKRRATRQAAMYAVMSVLPPATRHAVMRGVYCEIRLQACRVSPRQLNAWDGLPASCKAVIDGACDAMGIRDEDPRLVVLPPSQKRGAKGEYGVEIRVWVGQGQAGEGGAA